MARKVKSAPIAQYRLSPVFDAVGTTALTSAVAWEVQFAHVEALLEQQERLIPEAQELYAAYLTACDGVKALARKARRAK